MGLRVVVCADPAGHAYQDVHKDLLVQDERAEIVIGAGIGRDDAERAHR